MTGTKKPTKLRVTTVTTYVVDAGEVPDGVVAKLVEDAATAYPQSLSLGDTDWFMGDSCDYGAASVVSVEVELL